jgi:hypothetical protein
MRHATTPSGNKVSYQDDAGDPKHQILYSSVQVEAKQQREPDAQENFHDLLEKLSSAHEREIRSRMNRLEFEKADLERQCKALRSQLVEARGVSSDCDQLQMRRGSRREGEKRKSVLSCQPCPAWSKSQTVMGRRLVTEIPQAGQEILRRTGKAPRKRHPRAGRSISRNGRSTRRTWGTHWTRP